MKKRAGLTIPEWLVVLAIAALLTAIFWPVFREARDRVRAQGAATVVPTAAAPALPATR